MPWRLVTAELSAATSRRRSPADVFVRFQNMRGCPEGPSLLNARSGIKEGK